MALNITDRDKMSKFYTKYDLSQFNTVNKAYLSLFQNVFDLTKVLKDNQTTKNNDSVFKHVGKDISFLFNPKTKNPYAMDNNIKTSSLTKYDNEMLYFNVKGKEGEPWFKDESLIVGRMTSREIKIRLVNTLNYLEHVLVVPIEETLDEICERYLRFNYHARSYTWKDIDGNVLDMRSTLVELGLSENYENLEYVQVDEEDIYIPSLYLYFNDDLTIM